MRGLKELYVSVLFSHFNVSINHGKFQSGHKKLLNACGEGVSRDEIKMLRLSALKVQIEAMANIKKPDAMVQSSITNTFCLSVPVGNTKDDNIKTATNVASISLGMMLSSNCLAFSLADDIFFRFFIGILNPKSNPSHRVHQSTVIVDQLYDYVCRIQQKKLARCVGCTLLFDTWTSKGLFVAGMAVPFSCVDPDTLEPSMLLFDMVELKGRHTSASLALILAEIAQKWMREGMIIFGTMSDTARNVQAAGRELHKMFQLRSTRAAINDDGFDADIDDAKNDEPTDEEDLDEFFNKDFIGFEKGIETEDMPFDLGSEDEEKSRTMSCFCHVIELAIKSWRKSNPAIERALSRVQKMVVAVNSSTQRKDALHDLLVFHQQDSKSLKKDCVTRWTSVFSMIESTTPIFKYILLAFAVCPEFKECDFELPDENAYTLLGHLLVILKPFSVLSKLMQGELYHTLVHLPLTVKYILYQSSVCTGTSVIEKEMRSSLTKHFYDRLSPFCNRKICPALLAAYLHPCYSKNFNALVCLPNHIQDPEIQASMCNEIKVGVREIIIDWHRVIHEEEKLNTDDDEGSADDLSFERPVLVDSSNYAIATQQLVELKNNSLKEPFWDLTVDSETFMKTLLKIEKQNDLLHVYSKPSLAGMKKVVELIYSAPASSAGCERVYSGAGLIFRKHRNRLSGITGGKLVVIRHYFRKLVANWGLELKAIGKKNAEIEIKERLLKILNEISLM